MERVSSAGRSITAPALDAAQARALTDRAKERLSFASTVALAAVEDIRKVVDSGGFGVLGYTTAAAYLLAEFDVSGYRLDPAGRRELALTLVRNGVSRRATAKQLGVSEGTVRNDLSGAQDYAPERVLGADGRSYPSERPRAPQPSAPSGRLESLEAEIQAGLDRTVRDLGEGLALGIKPAALAEGVLYEALSTVVQQLGPGSDPEGPFAPPVWRHIVRPLIEGLLADATGPADIRAVAEVLARGEAEFGGASR